MATTYPEPWQDPQNGFKFRGSTICLIGILESRIRGFCFLDPARALGRLCILARLLTDPWGKLMYILGLMVIQ